MKIRVGHLYPDYLNIYADRGNIAVFARRGGARAGTSSRWRRSRIGDELRTGEHDLLYVGGGQDREQALIAPDLVGKGPAIEEAVDGGRSTARGLRRLPAPRARLSRPAGRVAPRRGPLPHDTVAGERRMIGDVLLECELVPGERRTDRGLREPRRAERASIRVPSRSAASSPASETTASRATRACRVGRAIGTYLPRPAPPRNPWLADWLLSQALGHATGGEPPALEPLPDRLEASAHAVSAERARRRGGRF